MQAARLGDLRDKLGRGNLTGVEFLIVNEQDALSRAMYWELKRQTAEGIPVYQQSPLQDDVWDTLQGDKDDFLVYDRCGRLTFHIRLPYSFLHYPYVEAAIRATHSRNICNCTLDSNSTSSNVTTGRRLEQSANASEPLSDNNNNKDHHHPHHEHDLHPQHHLHQERRENRLKQNTTATESPNDNNHRRHHHHHHHQDRRQKTSSTNPVITQTTSMTKVEEHTHHDAQHERP